MGYSTHKACSPLWPKRGAFIAAISLHSLQPEEAVQPKPAAFCSTTHFVVWYTVLALLRLKSPARCRETRHVQRWRQKQQCFFFLVRVELKTFGSKNHYLRHEVESTRRLTVVPCYCFIYSHSFRRWHRRRSARASPSHLLPERAIHARGRYRQEDHGGAGHGGTSRSQERTGVSHPGGRSELQCAVYATCAFCCDRLLLVPCRLSIVTVLTLESGVSR